MPGDHYLLDPALLRLGVQPGWLVHARGALVPERVAYVLGDRIAVCGRSGQRMVGSAELQVDLSDPVTMQGVLRELHRMVWGVALCGFVGVTLRVYADTDEAALETWMTYRRWGPDDSPLLRAVFDEHSDLGSNESVVRYAVIRALLRDHGRR